MRFLGSTSDEVIIRSAESRISDANLGSYINVRQNGYVMNIQNRRAGLLAECH